MHSIACHNEKYIFIYYHVKYTDTEPWKQQIEMISS